MALDFASLVAPLSPDEPCGPDLDLAGDAEFAQFVARSEGLFPASFFTRDDEGKLLPFDRGSIDFAPEFKALDKLLGTTRDLRLLIVYGRLLALNRDIAGFCACVEAIAAILREFWAEVPPRGDDGDYAFRAAVLQGLDDTPTVVLPLQYAPLFQSRRNGPITYRAVLVATGEVPAREGEQTLDKSSFERALADCELDDLRAVGARLRALVESLDAIQALAAERGGDDGRVDLEKLPPVAAKMAAFIDGAIAARDPMATIAPIAEDAAAPDGAAGASAGVAARVVPAGAIADAAAAERALLAILAYFQRSEPSSPARPLVQQALAVRNKPFHEVLQALLPRHHDDAKISIGADKLFGLTFDQLAAVSEIVADAGAAPETEDEIAVEQDAESAAEAESPDDGDETGSEEPSDDARVKARATPIPASTPPPLVIGSRAEVASYLDRVGTYYRVAEPSSPIPLFTDRARSLLERDFLAILRDVLPSIVPEG